MGSETPAQTVQAALECATRDPSSPEVWQGRDREQAAQGEMLCCPLEQSWPCLFFYLFHGYQRIKVTKIQGRPNQAKGTHFSHQVHTIELTKLAHTNNIPQMHIWQSTTLLLKSKDPLTYTLKKKRLCFIKVIAKRVKKN